MKRKGFTLIELLAVIVILAIIALIAVPTIINLVNESMKEAFIRSAYGIIKVGDLYYSNKEMQGEALVETTFEFPNNILDLKIDGNLPERGLMKISSEGDIGIAIVNGKFCITKGYEDKEIEVSKNIENCVIPIRITDVILSNNYFKMDEGSTETLSVTIEPENATNKNLEWIISDNSVLSVQDGVITAISEGLATITLKTTDKSKIERKIEVAVGYAYKNGIMASKDNCIIDGTCENGTEVKVDVNESTKHKFYVINDDGNEITLIMDRNLGDVVPWISEDDYVKNDDCSSVCHDQGPVTALKELDVLTSVWDNILLRKYTYIDARYPIIETEMRARLLNSNDINDLKTINEGVMPDYLYINLNKQGYWLSSTTIAKIYASRIKYDGTINSIYANGAHKATGLRPVITLSK